MRLLFATIAASAAFLAASSASGDDQSTTATPAAPTTTIATPVPPPLRHGCDRYFKVRSHRAYVRRVYRRAKVSRAARRRMALLRRCQRSGALERRAARFEGSQSAARQERRRVAAVTPFVGPDGRHWAVPWMVVYCESGGSWTEANSSGAEGPYQLLGHGQPWPVRTAHDRLRHHQIARALYLAHGLQDWSPSSGCWGGRT